MWSEYVMSEVLGRAGAAVRPRHYESPLALLYRIADTLLIALGLWAASLVTEAPWTTATSIAALIAAALFQLLAAFKDLYRSWRTEGLAKESWYVSETWLGVAGISLVAVYAQQELDHYRPDTISLWLVAAPALLILWRIGVRMALHAARRHGLNVRRLAIAGSGDLARHVASTVAHNPWMGIQVVGLFDDGEGAIELGVNRVRPLDALIELARRGQVDVVYVALPAGHAERGIDRLVRDLSDSTVSVYLVQDRRTRAPEGDRGSHQVMPDLSRIDVLHRTWVNLGGIKAVSVYESPFYGSDAWIKRVEDIVISGVALALLALPMLGIAIGVRLSSPGPVLFKQRRYGLDGREIMVWKFRSMTVCEDGAKVVQAQRNDARVTPFGAFLRRTSLDELPQFFNVFGGSMSIVGPRPHAVAHNEYYRGLISGYMLRHKVKPGITGWAQVNGWRGETDSVDKMGRRIDFDLDYIRRWSLWLDLRIVWSTAMRGFAHDNAY